MTPTPDARTTLAHALAALRGDLEAQPPPPASVLAAAERAARLASRGSARPPWPADASAAASAPKTWRLPTWLGGRGRAVAGLPGAAGAWGAWAGAATCAVVLGVSLLLALRPPQLPPVVETVAQPGAAWSAAGVPPARTPDDLVPAMHFVPLVSPERMRALSRLPGSSGAMVQGDTPAWVVTTELPQQRLAAMGLPYDPGHAAEPLRAELLVAPSGEVLAVRLLF